jgi:hypothetical protein
MKTLLIHAVLAASLALGVAACGDTRTNKELGGVATWPGGGSAAGPARESTTYYGSSAPAPAYYGSGAPAPATGYSTTETTTTTTTVRPAYR